MSTYVSPYHRVFYVRGKFRESNSLSGMQIPLTPSSFAEDMTLSPGSLLGIEVENYSAINMGNNFCVAKTILLYTRLSTTAWHCLGFSSLTTF